MSDDYYLDFQNYPLHTWQEELKKASLLPSRQILKEDLDARFNILSRKGISNLQELMDALKTSRKVREFASQTGLPEDYLLVLRREVLSLKPGPVKLSKLPGVKPELVEKLEAAGIKTTLELFKRAKTSQDRDELGEEVGLRREEILELAKLSDLSRIKWVGPVFARMFLEAGMDSVKKVSEADASEFYAELVNINQNHKHTKARFVENDLVMCIEFAKKLPEVMEY